jgi:molybdate transport system substrate-binding protein
MLRKLIATLLFSAGLLFTAGCSTEKPVTLSISAAGSLSEALTEVATLYMEQNNSVQVLTNFAASGDLQTQIENGAPADIFFSANAGSMNRLEEQNLIITETRTDLLTNSIVLIIPANNSGLVDSFAALTSPAIEKIAMGDPDFVPAGKYGLKTLELLDIPYEELLPKLVLGSNVMQVLSYVENGTVDAGILFATDAARSEKISVIATAPDAINDTIVYPAALVATTKNQEQAQHFLGFLSGEEAGPIFKKHGFVLIR